MASIFLLFCVMRFYFTTVCGVSPVSAATILGGAKPAMVLPLFHSSPNISKTLSKSHRHLQGSNVSSRPNARMGLYDDLLRTGYYTTRLWIGTPPQRFALIVDTGSTVTYVPCSTCEQCGHHEDPKFQPELSSTYNPVQCTSECDCDDEKKQCVYERQYAEMSTSSGVLGEDVISFGNQSELVPQRVTFGCENMETGDLYSQRADGIMGLGRGDLSVVDQLVEKGVIGDSFSLCYGGMDIGGGAMVLGGISPPSDMVFTDSDPARSPYYNIDLKEIHVAGERLPLKPAVFDGKYGTVVDSGTTYAYLPEEAFLAFKEAIMKELHSLKQIMGPDPNFNDLCFSVDGSEVSKLSNTFPTVDLVFGNGQKLSLSPENYLFRHSRTHPAYCLGIFQNGHDPTTLLGGIIFRNTFVMYDRENLKMGFWKTNCSELWERMHITDSPAPSASESQESDWTAEVAPALAPTDQGYLVIPDKLQIGKITFEMSLRMNYSDLKLHIAELMESIAQELGVNSSQVHLLNLTSKGNDSIIEWDMVPSGSANYMPNNTALKVISRVTEHQMQLPDRFGNYELLHWKIDPPRKLTWWQQHILVVGLTIIVVIFVVAMCIIWRQRTQTSNLYKPVDEAYPEQELQPL
ncbi:aspartic proteinase 36-like [Euphorbia lathyris]|uniref:aspartic proteinase 36-like n=1 Tax=Euphorbia lathyris TaxID=212925 RepID=UPI00331387DF